MDSTEPVADWREIQARIKAEPWTWRVEPATRFLWAIWITQGMTCEGPDGGPYLCLGTRRRAIRKAERLVARKTRRDARTERLTIEEERT